MVVRTENISVTCAEHFTIRYTKIEDARGFQDVQTLARSNSGYGNWIGQHPGRGPLIHAL